jgi:hypothetical protein
MRNIGRWNVITSETPLKLFPRQMTVIRIPVITRNTFRILCGCNRYDIKTGSDPIKFMQVDKGWLHNVVVLPRSNVKKVKIVFRGDKNCQ